jgi:serine/threonine-protein kinase
MGAVYEARHRNGARVAIKVMHSFLSGDERLKRRFLQEAYAANAVDHEGVVKIIDDDIDDDGTAFLVMELLVGESLDAKWRSAQRVLPEQALAWARDLLDVLAAAHRKGIIHRDIKPSNLFVTQRGEFKVLDFGIAGGEIPSSTSVNTEAGLAMGTPAFMSPEQARSRWDLVDARTDIWAVGATLFALLTGEFVHQAATTNEMLGFTMIMPARSLSSLLPDAPSGLVVLVDRALAYEVAARWSSAEQMRAACEQVLATGQLDPELSAGPAATAARSLDVSTVTRDPGSGTSFNAAEQTAPPSIAPAAAPARTSGRRLSILIPLASIAAVVGAASTLSSLQDDGLMNGKTPTAGEQGGVVQESKERAIVLEAPVSIGSLQARQTQSQVPAAGLAPADSVSQEMHATLRSAEPPPSVGSASASAARPVSKSSRPRAAKPLQSGALQPSHGRKIPSSILDLRK